MMNKQVREIMTPNPQTIDPEANVRDLSHYMLDNKVQQMPVVEDGKVIGMITVYDLWRNYENNTSLGHLKVREVMNTNIIKISPKDKVGTAAELFADTRFKTIPVVNVDGALKGVVTAFDIIRLAFNNEYSSPILYKEQFNK